MIELRPYQQEALSALYEWFEAARGSPLLELPTGAGKSVVQAEFMRSAIDRFPSTRILCLTHVKELIQQNYSALLRLWPSAPAGVYSAGLGQRQMHRQITFAGIQSIHRHADTMPVPDLVIVDECHLIPRNSETMYGRLFDALRERNPHLKVIGLTATPFRLDSGMLYGGDNDIFDGVAYKLPITRLIDDGYLAPLISKAPDTRIDLKGVRVQNGDYRISDLESAAGPVTAAAVEETIALGKDRKAWIVFCVSVDHAMVVRDELRRQGVTAEAVTGKTPAMERDRLIAAYKRGQIKALTSVGVLTTGFDAPETDMIVFLRPTQSAGLLIQMAGRGMRIAEGKENCLVLDFAENILRHGPIDLIEGKKPKRGKKGEAPTKICPQCQEILHTSARECTACGHEFEFAPADPEDRIQNTASTEAILSRDSKPKWKDVRDIAFRRHQKDGSPDSMCVEYLVGMKTVREWVCFEHSGFARQKACAWWRVFAGPHSEIPDTVTEALERTGELARPVRVTLAKDGRYHRVERIDFFDEETVAHAG